MKTLKTAIFQIMEFYVAFGMDWPYIIASESLYG
jgi:hypothetical protein